MARLGKVKMGMSVLTHAARDEMSRRRWRSDPEDV